MRLCKLRLTISILAVFAVLVLFLVRRQPENYASHIRKMTKHLETADLAQAPIFKDEMTVERPNYEFRLEPSIETMKPLEKTEDVRWTSIVIVKSAYNNQDRRKAIRETWASLKTFNGARFITVFLVGRPKQSNTYSIDAEHEEFRDILMANFVDTADHVPDKTLAGMQWAAEALDPTWIYSTADDDMSLHVPNFAKYIDTKIATHLSLQKDYKQAIRDLPIMCVYSYQKSDPPARDPESKWHMSEKRYPPASWPPYCRGGWYSMPVGLAGDLYEVSRTMNFLHLDDVWITGLMRIKYLAASVDEKSLMNAKLESAPLALRTDNELAENVGENDADVIVSHAWGNIEGKPSNVQLILRRNWRLWLSSIEKRT